MMWSMARRCSSRLRRRDWRTRTCSRRAVGDSGRSSDSRSEEHTSELQSRLHLVCRLLLEKNNNELHHARHPRRPGSTLKVHYDDPATFDAITPVLHAPPRPIDAHYQPTPPQPPASALAYA